MKLCECKCGFGMCASDDFVDLTATVKKMRDTIEAWKRLALLHESMGGRIVGSGGDSKKLLAAARKLEEK